MIETKLTALLGVGGPIQLAGMPGVGTPALVAAVAAAGGIGMIPAPMLPADALAGVLDDVATRTTGVFGVNFLMPFLDRTCVEVAARKARLVEFFYDDPDPELVRLVHSHDALVSWQVGSRGEAIAAERAGCDVIVAQGTEAGGHVRGQTGLAPLLAEVRGAVGVPVIAAGGIATARDVAAVLTNGAAGARIGTRFVASAESGAHPAWVQALLAASAADTCLTETFSSMWPNAPHRVLRSAVTAANAASENVVGEMQLGGQAVPVERFSAICPSGSTTGRIEAMALYAGTSVANVDRVQPAAEIVAELVSGTAYP